MRCTGSVQFTANSVEDFCVHQRFIELNSVALSGETATKYVNERINDRGLVGIVQHAP